MVCIDYKFPHYIALHKHKAKGLSPILIAPCHCAGQYFKYLPYITLGTLAVVSAFATVFLPESFGRPLPQTIEQMHKRER